jgi:iron(III) transport system substrate-binding protein
VAYLKRLAAQEPALKRGNSLRAQLVAAGESQLAIAYAGTVQVFTSKGAPINWVPLEPVVVQVYPIMLGAKAPHPNAARLFIDFVLSRESQKVIRDAARVPSRTDVEPNPPRLIQFDRIVENPEGFTDLQNTVKLFSEIFGLR